MFYQSFLCPIKAQGAAAAGEIATSGYYYYTRITLLHCVGLWLCFCVSPLYGLSDAIANVNSVKTRFSKFVSWSVAQFCDQFGNYKCSFVVLFPWCMYQCITGSCLLFTLCFKQESKLFSLVAHLVSASVAANFLNNIPL